MPRGARRDPQPLRNQQHATSIKGGRPLCLWGPFWSCGLRTSEVSLPPAAGYPGAEAGASPCGCQVPKCLLLKWHVLFPDRDPQRRGPQRGEAVPGQRPSLRSAGASTRPVPAGPEEVPACPARRPPNDGDIKDSQNLFSLQGTWGRSKREGARTPSAPLPSPDRNRVLSPSSQVL